MADALKLAEKAIHNGEIPIAAIIIDDVGKVVAKAHNLVEKYKNPLKHAELLVIEKALQKLKNTRSVNNRLEGYSIFVTLEPCPMCAAAISHARISRLYYAAQDEKGGGVENGARIFEQKSCFHKPEVISGIFSEKSEEMLRNYFKNLRKFQKIK
ncbi:MAG TPA: tRNA-specific adenosine deaminase [Alphaproteobacteria bacterium]|nr:tRNA-specific adenosine deaminase [Alphaproteobacteria bacterium]